MKALVSSPYVLGAAVLASLSGFPMGYDMGVISIINVIKQFHQTYPFAETAFGTEFMTAMLLLGPFVTVSSCLTWLIDTLASGRSLLWLLCLILEPFSRRQPRITLVLLPEDLLEVLVSAHWPW